jgi:hypothetical protein
MVIAVLGNRIDAKAIYQFMLIRVYCLKTNRIYPFV